MISEAEIDDFVRKKMDAAGTGAHTYDHVKRVYAMAIRIGKELGANLNVLGAAALLHDIGRQQEDETGVSHSILSGEMSMGFLLGIGFSQEDVAHIVEAIRTHRFSEALTPTSLEGEILSDADKLDAIGAIGVFRAMARAEKKGVGIEGFLKHADEKLLKLHAMMHTEAASVIAAERHEILERFVEHLRDEVSGAL